MVGDVVSVQALLPLSRFAPVEKYSHRSRFTLFTQVIPYDQVDGLAACRTEVTASKRTSRRLLRKKIKKHEGFMFYYRSEQCLALSIFTIRER